MVLVKSKSDTYRAAVILLDILFFGSFQPVGHAFRD